MRSSRHFSLFSCAVMMLAVFMLSGCLAKNEVRLLYDAPGANIVPLATAPRVVVVQFEDKRSTADIGVRKDGTAFQSSASVASWVTQALADELARQGIQVSVALSMVQAEGSKPDYIVAGTVDKVWLSEKNISSYQAEIRIQTRLQGGTQPEVTRTFIANQEKAGIPGAKLAEETLSGTLKDVLAGAASAIVSSAR
ncbi:MAG: hypothetical protein IKJ34_01690 [Mailhella sp.]|nr:hypothetical protein [Mailhella sp.]